MIRYLGWLSKPLHLKVSDATCTLSERGKTMEDSWFRKHELELIEAARARRESEDSHSCGMLEKERCCDEC
ncbi:MAG: hypothetical protein KC777_08680 [Cyanobacteria bacterium HKST-UBA02]|nr:hypothetical protein [Cyanobacteria bacterium HKST-UBA02]